MRTVWKASWRTKWRANHELFQLRKRLKCFDRDGLGSTIVVVC